MSSVKSKYVAFLIFVIQATALSQAIRTIGVKAGAVSASQTWDFESIPDLETRNRWGIDIGTYVEWLNIPVFSISTEIHYVQKGMRVSLPITTAQNPEGTGEYFTRSPRVDYLSIPILARARLSDGRFIPYVGAGLRVDILLQSKGDGFEAVIDKFDKVDFGVTIGLGAEIRSFENIQVGIEFRLSPSLKDSFASRYTLVRNSSMEFLFTIGWW
jgi:opacity protein-like surface antigen